MAKVNIRKDFQQARWNEPIIYELSTPGLRGIIPPLVENEIKEEAGNAVEEIPDCLKRKTSLDVIKDTVHQRCLLFCRSMRLLPA